MDEPLDQVRLLISDVGGESGDDFLYSDEEVNTFLALNSNVLLAAALALRAIAGNEAMVAKRIKFLELETDGPAMAKALRELAESLEQRADTVDETSGEVTVIEMAPEPFSQRQQRLGW